MTTTKTSRTIRRHAHRAVLGSGLGPIVAAIIVEICLASPGRAQAAPTCVFVGNNGPVGSLAGRIDAFVSNQGTLSPAGSTTAPQGGVYKMLVRAHTLLALSTGALQSFDINPACGLGLRSTVAVATLPDMALGNGVVYVSSSTSNSVSSVAIDLDGILSSPVTAPAGNPVLSQPMSIAAAAPMVYSLGRNFCDFPVQPGGMLGAPTCGTASSSSAPWKSLLVAGNVLYELWRINQSLTAARIDPATGNLTFVDAFPPTIAFDNLPLAPDPHAMAAWPDGSVVFVALQGGIASVGPPTSTQPHTVLAVSTIAGNADVIATDPVSPFLYGVDATQRKLFSIPVSGGFTLQQSNMQSTTLADQPLSVATWLTCTPYSPAQACDGRACGFASDGCGGRVACGSSCCTAAGACGSKTCGTVSDGCGQTFTCGSCSSGTTCNLGTCIRRCPQGQVFCDGQCTRPTNCQ